MKDEFKMNIFTRSYLVNCKCCGDSWKIAKRKSRRKIKIDTNNQFKIVLSKYGK